MVNFIIAAHGLVASATLTSINLLIKEHDNVFFIDAYINDECIENQVETVIKTLPKSSQIIVFSDLLHGSVNGAFLKYVKTHELMIVPTFNYSVILDCIAMDVEKFTRDDLQLIIENSKRQMIVINKDNVDEYDINLDHSKSYS